MPAAQNDFFLVRLVIPLAFLIQKISQEY